MVSNDPYDHLLQEQQEGWSYRVERGVGPTGKCANGWKITVYPISKTFPIFNIYKDNLPEWMEGLLAVLDAADLDMQQVGAIGSKLSNGVYWIKTE